jgi:hypothetical protein
LIVSASAWSCASPPRPTLRVMPTPWQRLGERIARYGVDAIGRRDTSPPLEVSMTQHAKWLAAQRVQTSLRSAGRPSIGRREDRVRFCAAIARERYPERAVRKALALLHAKGHGGREGARHMA